MTARTPAEVRKHLRDTVAGWNSLAAHAGTKIVGPVLMPETVLRAGIDCIAQPLPRRYKKRWPKMCFMNASRLARRSRGRLTYVEGFVMTGAVGLTVHHAWCIDARGRVVDPTLEDPSACAYVGVPIPLDTYNAITRGDYSASVFEGEFRLRIDVLRDLCPSLGELLEAA